MGEDGMNTSECIQFTRHKYMLNNEHTTRGGASRTRLLLAISHLRVFAGKPSGGVRGASQDQSVH